MIQCYDKKTLISYLTRKLEKEQITTIKKHVHSCKRCSGVLQSIVAEDDGLPTGFVAYCQSRTDESEVIPQIPGFEQLEKIGDGGMGVVYSAINSSSKRKVAVKLVKRSFDIDQTERFEREYKLLASVEHQYVARLYQVGICHSSPFVAMEFVDGKNIFEYCVTNRLTLRERLVLFLQVCDAIQFLHTRPIVHRDLKPQNILVATVDGCPIPKVIDFGLAKLLNSDQHQTLQTSANTIMGTLPYMSPEQTDSKTDLLGTLTDQYSLGVVLFELLTGETPVSNEELKRASREEAYRLIQEREALAPSKQLAAMNVSSLQHSLGYDSYAVAKQLQGDLDAIILQALRKEPGNRYKSVSDFADDIQRYLACEPVRAVPRSKVYDAAKFLKKHRLLVGFTGALILSLLGGVLGTSYWLVKARAAEKSAVEFANRESDAKDLANQLRETEKQARIEAEQATARAELRRKKMQKASLLLRGFFNGLNPEIADGGDGQLRGTFVFRLKESAKEMLDDDLSEDEDVLLLRESLANTLVAFGEVKSAVPLWETIVEDLVALRGEETEDSLSGILNLGLIYTRNAQHNKAKAEFDRARRICEKILKPSNPTSIVVDHYACANLESLQQFEASLEIRKSLIARLGRPTPETQHLRNDILGSLGVVQMKLGHYADAKNTLEQAVQEISQSLRGDHPIVLKFRSNLATAKSFLNDSAGAEKEYRRILAAQTNQYPAGSEALMRTKISLATHLAKSGKIDEGTGLLSEVAETSTDESLALYAKVELALVRIRILNEKEAGLADLRDVFEQIKEKLSEQHSVYVHCQAMLSKYPHTPAQSEDGK